MPPKRGSSGGARGGSSGGSKGKKSKRPASRPESSNAFDSTNEATEVMAKDAVAPRAGSAGKPLEPEKSIPKELLTRLLHEMFAKEATRISRDANSAAGKYLDVFVREAIARAAVDKNGDFLEVEDLERIAPQLLLDL
ncbi:hypothetical protein CDD82_2212 [Ophiocordyceps australis]|uniref:Centromere protein X n=1 Tax=Ophiocordyceps australis TaxID=1399860 RepID=A0A2C5ZIX6_9HYPO|nr:hypothetical protein CDD82_2212 [Ophiocordyceps australis]